MQRFDLQGNLRAGITMPRGYKGRIVSSKEANKRWREKNPDKVREHNRKPRVRKYDSAKRKAWRERRLLNPEYRIRINAQANDRATKVRRWLDEYKLKVGCIDCGYNKHAVALEFDHVDWSTKSFNVCNASSISQALEEIKKCEVRCANCHRVKTAERRNIVDPA